MPQRNQGLGPPGAPEDTSRPDWNAAAVVLAIIAAQVYGAVLALGVLCWRSTVARAWTLAGVGATLAAALFSWAVLADLVLARSLLIIAACVAMVWFDAAMSRTGTPNLLCSGVYGAWISFAAMVPIMVANPYRQDRLWPTIYQSAAVETAQWMTLVGVLSFGAGLAVAKYLFRPIERLWLRIWDWRFNFADGDGGFTLAAITFLGLAAFLTRGFFQGFGFFTSGSLPTSASWIVSGLWGFFYLSVYIWNARVFSSRKLSVTVLSVDLALMAYELSSGSKGRFAVLVLFPLLLVYIFCRRRVPWSIVGVFGGLSVVAVFIVYPLLFSYREDLVSDRRNSGPNASLMVHAAGSWSESYQEKMDHVFLRGSPAEQVLAATSIIFFDVRHDNTQLWGRLAGFLVPRALWPDKPQPMMGWELGQESHRLDLYSEGTDVVLTGIGELYVYYGPIGAVGMLLAGFVFRFLDMAGSAFRSLQPLRIGVSVFLFREFPGLVGGAYETAITAPLSAMLIMLIAMSVMSVAALVLSRPPGSLLAGSGNVMKVGGNDGR